MNEELKKELHKHLDRPRPRPLMFIGWHNGKKVYVRNQSLSYFQLLEKYPRLRKIDIIPKPRHVFARKHHLFNKPEHEHIYGCILAGCGIAIWAFIIMVYSVIIIRSL